MFRRFMIDRYIKKSTDSVFKKGKLAYHFLVDQELLAKEALAEKVWYRLEDDVFVQWMTIDGEYIPVSCTSNSDYKEIPDIMKHFYLNFISSYLEKVFLAKKYCII